VETTATQVATTRAHAPAILVIQYFVIVFPPKHFQEKSSRDDVQPHCVTLCNDLSPMPRPLSTSARSTSRSCGPAPKSATRLAVFVARES
jgi:hypothetical protein